MLLFRWVALVGNRQLSKPLARLSAVTWYEIGLQPTRDTGKATFPLTRRWLEVARICELVQRPFVVATIHVAGTNGGMRTSATARNQCWEMAGTTISD